MPEPLKRNPFPWWPFWPEVEDHSPRKTVAAIIVVIAVVAACYWLS
jgi:hypothetical protein